MGSLSEPDRTIVIDVGNCKRSFVPVFTVFADGTLFHNYFVTYSIGVRGSLSVFAFIVLTDESLFPFFDKLPVRFEVDILNRIAIEYQLCWCGLCGSVYGGSHREADC